MTTGLDPMLARASMIEMEDNALGSGGFGVAYRAFSFDGRQVVPQVIKLLTARDDIARHGFETIQKLQQRLSDKNAALLSAGSSLPQQYPALLGVPQLSFEGELDGARVLGYSANDLTAAGFEEFSQILSVHAKNSAFQTMALAPRLLMSLQLVRAFVLLSELQFIHADIKADAVFVDLKATRCAIIDYDGGAVMNSAADKPLTYGALQEWLAPEIIRQLSPSNTSGQIKVDRYSDVWSINFALHYLLTALPPFFFFTEISERSMRAYRQAFKWPDVDGSFPYFDQQQAYVHTEHVRRLSRLPSEIVKKFEFIFTHGFLDPNQRASYSQWETVLQATGRPVIHFFRADRNFVDDTRPVRLTWSTGPATHLEIVGAADVTGKNTLSVKVKHDSVFQLVLTSFSGQKISKTVHVQVSKKPPVIHFFKSSSLLLTDDAPVRLSWHVSGAEKLHIDNGAGDVTGRSKVELCPRSETGYTLTATSPFGVSTQATVRIQVSSTPPTINHFTSDRALVTDKVPVTLSWSVSQDAYEVTISEVGAVLKSGTIAVPQRRDTTYVLTATSYFSFAASRSLTVLVSKEPPVIAELNLSPAFVREGTNCVVRWKVRNAEDVFLEPGGHVASAGQMSICIPPSGLVRMEALSYFGVRAHREASVAVLKKTALTARRTALTDERTVLTVRRGKLIA
jgi:serine/threonine protein kinase